jgi:PCO_ADO
VYSRILYGELQRVRLDLSHSPDEHVDDDDNDTTSKPPQRNHSKTGSPAHSNNQHHRSHTSTTTTTNDTVRRRRAAFLHPPDLLRAPDLAALFPHDGNLHQFVAGRHGAAVLDVLIPPYDEDNWRDCTYYEVLPLEEEQQQKDDDDDDDAMDIMDNSVAATTSSDEQGGIQVRRPCWVAPCSVDENFTCLGGTYAKWKQQQQH